MKYRVTRTLKGRSEEAVDVPWLRSGSAIEAASTVAAILAEDSKEDSVVPKSVRVRTVRIVVDLVDDVEEVSEADGDAADAHVSGGSA